MRILVGVPVREGIMPETVNSIMSMDCAGNEVSFGFERGHDCSVARNRLCKLAVEGGFDYVMQVDADVVFPQDTLVKLLACEADVAFGCVPGNILDNRPTVFKVNGYSYLEEDAYTLEELNEAEEVIDIHGAGAACMLIKVESLVALPYPWFKFVDEVGNFTSEDLYFCNLANSARMKVRCNTKLICQHYIGRWT